MWLVVTLISINILTINANAIVKIARNRVCWFYFEWNRETQSRWIFYFYFLNQVLCFHCVKFCYSLHLNSKFIFNLNQKCFSLCTFIINNPLNLNNISSSLWETIFELLYYITCMIWYTCQTLFFISKNMNTYT